jgi:polysaccharide export outer membrane protein
MTRSLLLALVLVLGLVDLGRAQVDGQGIYRIQPGDVLSVSVLEDPGLNQTVLVRPDGRISLPLAGTIQVEGLSPEDAQNAIRRNLSREFVSPPTVTVALQSSAGEAAGLISVYVLGQVGNAGRFDVEAPIELLQLLAIAGGPSPFAATSRIQVRRRTQAGDEVRLFDYDSVEEGLVPIEQIMIRDGDVIVVPERSLFE